MKIISLILTGMIVLPSLAYAADGTITITGKVLDNTCTIGGTSPGNYTVKLPTVIKSAFTAINTTAGEKDFQIELTNCPSPANISVFFESTNTNVDTAGRLNNTATGGSTAQVELVNGTERINLKGTTLSAQSTTALTFNSSSSTTNSHTFPLKARYYALTYPVTVGDVATSITYNIVYD